MHESRYGQGEKGSRTPRIARETAKWCGCHGRIVSAYHASARHHRQRRYGVPSGAEVRNDNQRAETYVALEMDRDDRTPGRAPRIDVDRGVTTLTFQIVVYEGRLIELVVRCKETGEMFAALRSTIRAAP